MRLHLLHWCLLRLHLQHAEIENPMARAHKLQKHLDRQTLKRELRRRSMAEIADEYGISLTAVWRYAQSLGLSVQQRREVIDTEAAA